MIFTVGAVIWSVSREVICDIHCWSGTMLNTCAPEYVPGAEDRLVMHITVFFK